jgi:putative restriction endonuclease
MAVRLVVAVTDYEWFAHLRNLEGLPEVNFWSPSDVTFRALEPGELFLFKLHAPRNYIVGGGIFTYSNALPCSLAWEAFGEANGAASLSEMRARIGRYRRLTADTREDFTVGCRILTQPLFLGETSWLSVPDSWSRNIVSFKTYSTDDPDGEYLWNAIADHLSPSVPVTGLSEIAARYGQPTLIQPRLGQGAFRVMVTDSYRRRCAITGERTLPALDAAHIRPYSSGGNHEASNGLLLRRDIHSLFDSGYVTVTSDYHFEVSRRIHEEFENGRDYYALHGKLIALPPHERAQPSAQALKWHNEQAFKG